MSKDNWLDLIKLQGGRARLANVPRNSNPYWTDALAECRAWFDGWDKVDKAERQIKEYES